MMLRVSFILVTLQERLASFRKTSLMFRFTLLLSLLILNLSVVAQMVYIPDANFRTFLQSQYPNCMIGDSLNSQCQEILDEYELDVSGLSISTLEGVHFFVSLQELDCTTNPLTELPELPENLRSLDCSNTSLETIESLPPLLDEFFAVNCELIQLPSLPQTLIELWVNGNNITYLPELPGTLEHLECRNNNLRCLPSIPNVMNVLAVMGNDLACLPELPANLLFIDVELSPCIYLGVHDCTAKPAIVGRVFVDSNNNCSDDVEVGLRNRVVQSSEGVLAITDNDGFYQLFSDTGSFVLSQVEQPLWSVNCAGIPYLLAVDTTQDTISGIDFANTAVEDCHWLSVDVGSSNQRPCFSTNSYVVSYCNSGTEGAVDVYVDLTFPSEIIPLNSSIPWQELGGGVYRFEVGDLAIDECGSFNIRDSVLCDAVVGSTVCVTAEIFPISPCLIATAQPGWDNSSVAISGSCSGTNVEFLVENTGTGNMSSQPTYRLFQDNALLDAGVLTQLAAGASTSFSQPADGAAYRLEVNQSIGHPGVSLPRTTVEGCGSPVSLGQVLVSQQNDVDDHIEISCIELTASYDPNDKRVVPAGYGAEHIVHPNDSLLEYTIRFQNTGSDTAFTVEVVDTLPTEFLNPITFLSGASSHPYTVRMHGNGIVTWRFEDILLPDSATNELGSQGFVKFKIRTRPDLPNGTVINNRANIFFDFNAAIVTETCFITISDIAIIASSSEIQLMDDGLAVYPNPASNRLGIRIKDNRIQPQSITVYDLTGREVFRSAYTPQIDVSGLSAGNYVVSVLTDKGVFREKVVIAN